MLVKRLSNQRLMLAVPWILLAALLPASMLTDPQAWFGTLGADRVASEALRYALVPAAVACGALFIPKGGWLAAFAVPAWFVASFMLLVIGLGTGMTNVPLEAPLMLAAMLSWLATLAMAAVGLREGAEQRREAGPV